MLKFVNAKVGIVGGFRKGWQKFQGNGKCGVGYVPAAIVV